MQKESVEMGYIFGVSMHTMQPAHVSNMLWNFPHQYETLQQLPKRSFDYRESNIQICAILRHIGHAQKSKILLAL